MSRAHLRSLIARCRTDRSRGKIAQLPGASSLEIYALVDQFHPAGTLYRRTERGWEMEFLTEANDVIALGSIDCTLPLSAIYERTYLLRDAM